MTTDPRWSAETENGLTQMLAEQFVVSTTGSRDPNRVAARAVLDWMAHRGLLVEVGGGYLQYDCPGQDCRRHAAGEHSHSRYVGTWLPIGEAGRG